MLVSDASAAHPFVSLIVFISIRFPFISFTFLSFACIFLSFCIHVLYCSFHLDSCLVMFLSESFHVNSNVHLCPFIVLLFACMFLSFCIHVLLISFPRLWKWDEMGLWLGRRTKCNKGYKGLSLSYG